MTKIELLKRNENLILYMKTAVVKLTEAYQKLEPNKDDYPSELETIGEVIYNLYAVIDREDE